MRVLLWFTAIALACPATAQSDLAEALLHARDGAERTTLLENADPENLADALAKIEKQAQGHAASHDCKTAIGEYAVAIDAATAAHDMLRVATYYRRTGLCDAELAETQAGLEAYRKGIAAAEQTKDTEILAENLHGAAVQLNRLGLYREAVEFGGREYDLTMQCGHPDHQLRALLTYSSSTFNLGHLRQALVLGERAVEIAHKATLPNGVDFATANLAMYYSEVGDTETGLRLLRSAKELNGNALMAIGGLEKRLGHYSEAEKAFEEALNKTTDPVDWRSHIAVLYNLGDLEHAMGNRARAREFFTTTLEQAEKLHEMHITSLAKSQLSELSSDEKNGAAALSDAEEALRLARESEGIEAIFASLAAEGRALEVLDRDTEARATYGEAISAAEAIRANAPPSAAALQDEMPTLMPAYQSGIALEIRAGRTMDALRLADRAKARVLLDMLDGGESGLEAFADPVERVEEQKARAEVARARRVAITKPDPASKAALEKALREAEAVDVRLYGRHPELVLQRAAAPDILPEQLARIASGKTAILSYFVMQDSVALFVIRAGEKPGVPNVRVFSLPGGNKLDGKIRAFRNQIATRDIDYRTSARGLYDTLIGPAAAALRGSDRWILSPAGSLWDVPFQALIDPTGKHVLEIHTVTYAPSLSTLWQLEEKPKVKRGGTIPLLAVANPAVKGVDPIPDAEREAREIGELYPGGVTLTGDRARAALFRQSANAADVIHIASHAETETNHPLESFLALSPEPGRGALDDGTLTARDILGLKLQANLVVLSACETARGKIGQGEGVLGLGWAVLAAGARASVLSQWKVDSAATADLMIDFHRRLKGAKTPEKSEALRQASLATMRMPGRQHPFYWASFILVGDDR